MQTYHVEELKLGAIINLLRLNMHEKTHFLTKSLNISDLPRS